MLSLLWSAQNLRTSSTILFHATLRGAWYSLLMIVACTWIAGPTFAADDDEEADEEAEMLAAEEEFEAETTIPESTLPPAAVQRATEDGAGVMGNVGFLGLSTFGRNDSIAPAEVMPYILLDENFVFSDVRGFVSTEGYFGGNFGVGYRRLMPNQHAWYGVNAWYDVDDTSSQMFHQLGFGVEAAFKYFEFRSNAYFPVGGTSKTLETNARNARFVNQQLVFDQQIMRGYALSGVDAEVGVVVPVPKLGETSQVRWFVGGYFFGGNGNADGINGFQTRSEMQLASTVTSHLQYTNDQEYGSNVMVGVTIDFPFGEAHPTSRWRRNTPTPFRYVHRNYNVILDRQDESQFGVAAINPRTGSAYTVAHVDSEAGSGGTGSLTDPLATLAAAQASGADLIFVHSGSVLNESIVLNSGVQLIGDTGNQWIDLAGSQTTRLPSLNDSGAAAPRITGVTGDAIELGDGSSVRGFTLDNIYGNGIVGDGISGATIEQVTFSDISGDAMRFTDSTGSIRIRDVTVSDGLGNGLVVTGGDANLNLDIRSSTFSGIGGDALRLDNIDDGSITIVQVTAEDVGDHGLSMTDVDADVITSGLTVTNSGDTAIKITGGTTGVYNFNGQTKLENVNGGLELSNSAADITFQLLDIITDSNRAAVTMQDVTGELHLDSLSIEADGGTGVLLRDVDDLTIDGGIVTTVGAAAFDAEDSHFEISIDRVNVDDAPVGIRLVDTTGGFTVVGGGNGGGVIENTDVGAFVSNSGTVKLQNIDFIDNGTAIQSSGNELLAVYGGYFSGSTGYALDSMNDKLLSVQASVFDGNGAVDGGTIRARANVDGTYRSEFLMNTIGDANGTPIELSTTGTADGSTLQTTISGNTIIASRGGKAAVDIDWTGPLGITANSNNFTLSGSAMTGFRIKAPSTTDAVSASINSNTMTISGTNSLGMNFIIGEESNLQLQSNAVTFSAAGGTGMRFELSGTTATWLATNTITDNGSAGTGFLFAKVADNSRIQFDANKILLNSTSSAIDRGIIFDTIDGTVQLYGIYDNTVTGASDVFFIPSGKSTGSFTINGTTVP